MKWLHKLFERYTEPILRNQFTIQEQILNLSNQLESLEMILRSMDQSLISLKAREEIESAALNQANETKPLAASRPSWPRMKRTMEERDVLNGLNAAKQQQSSIEEYWKNKSV